MGERGGRSESWEFWPEQVESAAVVSPDKKTVGEADFDGEIRNAVSYLLN